MNENTGPHISINAQYIKDLSFENPGAPGSLAAINEAPEIDLSLDINVSKLDVPDSFEVSLKIEAEAKYHNEILFVIDLEYAGVFTLSGVNEDQQKILLAVHCPAMIFPFARKVIADVTQDGGFQPLMIDPIDFGTLFQSKMMAEAEENEAAEEHSGNA